MVQMVRVGSAIASTNMQNRIPDTFFHRSLDPISIGFYMDDLGDKSDGESERISSIFTLCVKIWCQESAFSSSKKSPKEKPYVRI